MTNEVTTKEETAVAAPLEGYGAFAGAGNEDVGKDDVATPLINILQDRSKAVKEQGAEIGDILNSSTGEIVSGKEGIEILVCSYERNFVEWGEGGTGNFIAAHSPNSKVVKDAEAASTKFGDYKHNGNKLSDTRNFYCLLIGEEGVQRAIIPFAVSKIKGAKKLVAMVAGQQTKDAEGNSVDLPFFALKIKLTTEEVTFTKGESFVWVPSYANGNRNDSILAADDPLLVQAVQFRELVKSGKAEVDYNKANDAETDESVPF